MNVARGTSLKAAALAARLVEDRELEFHSVLQSSNGDLEFYGNPVPQAEPVGRLELWWGVDIDARSWGIKDINVYIKKLVLDGHYEDYEEDESAEGFSPVPDFHHEYPIAPEPKGPAGPSSAPDDELDSPTPENLGRLTEPKWTVSHVVDSSSAARTRFAPSAEINLSKHTIKITF